MVLYRSLSHFRTGFDSPIVCQKCQSKTERKLTEKPTGASKGKLTFLIWSQGLLGVAVWLSPRRFAKVMQVGSNPTGTAKKTKLQVMITCRDTKIAGLNPITLSLDQKTKDVVAWFYHLAVNKN